MPTVILKQGSSSHMSLSLQSQMEGLLRLSLRIPHAAMRYGHRLWPSSCSAAFWLDAGRRAAHTQAVCLSLGQASM